MPTFKVVIIGASGVDKTSLRQECFVSLPAAFFRGADAAVLMYNVTRPETLATLTTW
ncbi:hypothetical protein B0H17DRAFT_1213514 [Mycena rosella]|uniref:Uncharacterized protein n=1 Tax=Mycena rosella TaxID=1033263 RepID=A0AAD7CQS2_MYCRO|nr:hypothetical protein B0H17DRAFT_1213514 [Mycena rosella]